MVILDGSPRLNIPLTVSIPPHDASHMVAIGVGAGYEYTRKGVVPSKGHEAPPDIRISPVGQLQEVRFVHLTEWNLVGSIEPPVPPGPDGPAGPVGPVGP